jgi:hypothetical protein
VRPGPAPSPALDALPFALDEMAGRLALRRQHRRRERQAAATARTVPTRTEYFSVDYSESASYSESG